MSPYIGPVILSDREESPAQIISILLHAKNKDYEQINYQQESHDESNPDNLIHHFDKQLQPDATN